jgi:hypothetical protein
MNERTKNYQKFPFPIRDSQLPLVLHTQLGVLGNLRGGRNNNNNNISYFRIKIPVNYYFCSRPDFFLSFCLSSFVRSQLWVWLDSTSSIALAMGNVLSPWAFIITIRSISMLWVAKCVLLETVIDVICRILCI